MLLNEDLYEKRNDVINYCEKMMRQTNLGKNVKICFGGVKKRLLDKGFITERQFNFLKKFWMNEEYWNDYYYKYERLVN